MNKEEQTQPQEEMLETHQKKAEDRVVRILSKDIEGKTKIYSGLTKIKGISWGI